MYGIIAKFVVCYTTKNLVGCITDWKIINYINLFMKIRAYHAVVAGAALAMVATGCSKKMSQFKAEYFNVNPSPLEVVGTNVPAVVTANVPAKFFTKNAEVKVTPYLVFDGTEVAAVPTIVQGEKVRGNNTVISYDYGGMFAIPVNYAYQPEMIDSDLELAFEVTQGGKQYVLPRVKVADGVIATAAFADAATVAPAIAPDKFQRVINERYSADIRFLINQATVRGSETSSDAMKAFTGTLREAAGDSTRVIEEINISSYASPEGSLDFNTALARKREMSTETYLKDQLKRDKITEFGELTSQFTPEDWEGFRKLVQASDIQDKELILSVLSMYKDPEEREREIRNISVVFDQLADQILPQLRYSRLTASINVIGKSDEEIKALFNNNPRALTVDELLYCATLTDDIDERKAVYAAATRLFPDDYRGYNNLGMTQYVERDYNGAAASFAKAARLAPNSPEVQMNTGLLALLNNDYQTASRSFGNAGGVKELNDALGVYYLRAGDAVSAAKAFGDSHSNNAALAQILTKDYSKARATLAAVAHPDATTYYLGAVLGARTNNESMVMDNLRKAVRLDDSLAAHALSDKEFSRFNVAQMLNGTAR